VKEKVAQLREFLKGRKTYIGLIGGSLYACAIIAGLVPSNEYVWLLIGTWTTVSFRAAL